MTAMKLNASALALNVGILAFSCTIGAPTWVLWFTGAAIITSSIFTALSWWLEV